MPRMLRASLALVGFALLSSPTRADFLYDDFSSTTGLQLNGNATTGIVAPATGTALRLTPGGAFQAGSAFTTTAVPLGNQASFSTYFQFQMPNAGGIGDGDGLGADGIVFVVQGSSNSVVGSSGAGMGYQGIDHSLGVEIDTFDNLAPTDLDGNHVGVDLNGNIQSVIQVNEPMRFNDGQTWNMWVDYNGTSKMLDISWSLSTTHPTVPQIAFSLASEGGLVGLLGQSSAFMGFTAGTGGAFADQDILKWQFSQISAVPEPGALTLAGLGMASLFGWNWRRRKSTAS